MNRSAWGALVLLAYACQPMAQSTGSAIGNEKALPPTPYAAKGADTVINFGDRFGANTEVTSEFSDLGILVSGEGGGPAAILEDRCQPRIDMGDTLVISGSLSDFQGSIRFEFIDPATGQPRPVAKAGGLQVGCFGNPSSTRLRAFGVGGKLLADVRNRTGSGNSLESMIVQRAAPDILAIEFQIVEDEPQGYAVNQLVYSGIGEPLAAGDTVNAGSTNDPVDTFTGELYEIHRPDLVLRGPFPLYFERFYSSRLVTVGRSGALGRNWRHNFEWTMTLDGDVATVITGRGRQIQFDKDTQWNLIGRFDTAYQFAESLPEYVLYDPTSDWFYFFAATGELLRIEDRTGNEQTLSYAADQLATVSDGLGRSFSFSYDMSGRLQSVSDGTRALTFGHIGPDLTSFTDARGMATQYVYDADGRLLSATLPMGNTPWTQTYDAMGRVLTQEDAHGNQWTYAYAGDQTTITDPLGNATVHQHSGGGELIGITDPADELLTLGYDGDGKPDGYVDREGGMRTRTYLFPFEHIESDTDVLGNTTLYEYQGFSFFSGQIQLRDQSQVTYADGSTETHFFNSLGQLGNWNKNGVRIADFAYNSFGQVTQFNPVGYNAENFQYDAAGNLVSLTTHAGNAQTFVNDPMGRVSQVTFADGNQVSYSYDAQDHMVQIENENGAVLDYVYNDNGYLTTATNALGETTSFVFDAMDRQVQLIYPSGATVDFEYDALGRVSAITDPAGRRTEYEYDAVGRNTAVVDAGGGRWGYQFNREGVRTASIDPLGRTTTYAPNALGLVENIGEPGGGTTTYVYDAKNRVSTVTDPNQLQYGLSYAPDGLPDGATEHGVTAGFVRDLLGAVTQLTDGNGQTWEMSRTSQMRVGSQVDPLGRSTTFGYDNRNRVSLVTYPAALGTLTVTYDANGNAETKAYSDGTTLTFTRDLANRLTGGSGFSMAYDADGFVTGSNGIAITRDASGALASIELDPARVVSYGAYDGAGRVLSISDWVGGTTAFAYNDAGDLVSISRPNGVTTSYTYDANARVASIIEAAGPNTLATTVLTRDMGGRIVSARRDRVPLLQPEMLNIGYDAASAPTGNGYGTDELGRRLTDPRGTYSWDLASRLDGRQAGSTPYQYTYDALGQRTGIASGGVNHTFVWNYGTVIPTVAMEAVDGTPTWYYVYAPGGKLLHRVNAAGDRQFYHFDELGNAAMLTDDSGTIIATYDYGPYGELFTSTGAVPDNRYTWQGMLGVQHDGDGLYYARARYYDAHTASFLSRDPLPSWRPKQVNPYQYARANPLAFVDPTGLAPRPDVVAAGTCQANTDADIKIRNANSKKRPVRLVFYNGNLDFATRFTVSVQGGLSYTDEDDILSQVANRLGPNDYLETLEIIDHSGGSAVYIDNKFVSSLGDNGIAFDPGLRAFYDALKHYFGNDSRVIFNQCEVTKTARGKSLIQNLADYLGVRVYGPTRDVDNAGFLSEWDLYRDGFIYSDPAWLSDQRQMRNTGHWLSAQPPRTQ